MHSAFAAHVSVDLAPRLSYSFWKEIDSETAVNSDGEELLLLTIRSELVGMWGFCTQEQEGRAQAAVSTTGYRVIRGEGLGDRNDGRNYYVVAEHFGLEFVATREVFTLIGGDVMRIDLVTTIQGVESGRPALCTFSGTVDVIRAR